MSKSCFVISPIGDKNSPTRQRSDQVLQYIISPVLASLDFGVPVRSDLISEPGIITSQIVEHLFRDDLVIADLSEKNANVFYELGIRHLTRKPVIHLALDPKEVPFDVSSMRVIKYDHQNLDVVEETKKELAKQIIAILQGKELTSPVSAAIDIMNIQVGSEMQTKLLTELVGNVREIKTQLGERLNPKKKSKKRTISPILVQRTSLDHLRAIARIANAFTENAEFAFHSSGLDVSLMDSSHVILVHLVIP